MPKFKIHHVTRYHYDRPVRESVNTLRIYPISDSWQTISQFNLSISNQPWVEEYLDYFGNRVGDFTVLQPHNELVIDARVSVTTNDIPQEHLDMPCNQQQLADACHQNIQLLWLALPEHIKEQGAIDNILKDLDHSTDRLAELVRQCSEYIFSNFRYVKGITSVETTVDEILDHRSGVCQDFAHVMLQMLRTLHIPARYVSGYICPNRSGLRGEGATHAWVEYFHPGWGWVGIDPTNNVWVDGHHVKLATGRDFRDCTPVKGTFKGIAHQSLSVFVSVGYEDGHVFEDVNQVKVDTADENELEPWQSDYIEAQQQQQQQQQ